MTVDKLIFNNESENFEVNILGGEKSYILILSDFIKEEQTKATTLANKISNWVDTNIGQIKTYVASKLLQLKNNSWLEENEEPLSQATFIDKINIESILVFSDESFQIYFTDNDIFWGHAIAVDIDQSLNFKGANLAG